MKAELLSNGLDTKIVAADLDWDIARYMAADSELDDAVDVIGIYYVKGTNSDDTAKASGKKLWDSEEGVVFDHEQFIKGQDIKVEGNSFTIEIKPRHILFNYNNNRSA